MFDFGNWAGGHRREEEFCEIADRICGFVYKSKEKQTGRHLFVSVGLSLFYLVVVWVLCGVQLLNPLYNLVIVVQNTVLVFIEMHADYSG